MAIGWMCNHFVTTVTIAWNSGMIGFGWQTRIHWQRPSTKKRPKRVWPPLQAQLLPVWVVALLIRQCAVQINWLQHAFLNTVVRVIYSDSSQGPLNFITAMWVKFHYPPMETVICKQLAYPRSHLHKGGVSWEYTHPLRWRNFFLHRGAKIDSPLA